MVLNPVFFKDKKILVTGHTGFKGSWLCYMLTRFGAEVYGYALPAPTNPALFDIIKLDTKIHSINGDIRDIQKMKQVFEAVRPEIVFHLAAQPLVREGYANPVATYETNVMGTVNLLECVRLTETVKSVLNITTDKVYKNNEWEWGYRENEPLDGFDPYSNSKSCSELVTHCYKNSFFADRQIAVSTARAGNVIGGGDFAKDRIIPDCVRFALKGEDITVRNPYSIRPYQHVLEPLYVYLLIAEKQYENINYAGYYNVGPDDADCITTGELVGLFCQKWGKNIKWENKHDDGPHEANFLKLDCAKLKSVFNWRPRWNIAHAIQKVVDWSVCWQSNGSLLKEMDNEIADFLKIDD